jgi:hypothetical protein
MKIVKKFYSWFNLDMIESYMLKSIKFEGFFNIVKHLKRLMYLEATVYHEATTLRQKDGSPIP